MYGRHTTVIDISLYSGASRTMLTYTVPQGKIAEGEVPIRCAHGDQVKIPLCRRVHTSWWGEPGSTGGSCKDTTCDSHPGRTNASHLNG